ncbi:MAG TPA: hypothetical protein VK420_23580, partial [Longimicrobium sp.]|nr:hypothetical protein [Longimicrobium sp.]
MNRFHTVAAAATLLAAIPAACQSGLRQIGPGSAEVRAAEVRERADTLDLLMVQGGGAQEVGKVVLRTAP